MEFCLSGSLSHELFLFHDGILAIAKPFSRTFSLFSQWNSGYHEAFLTNFLFFTMEFWLSRSLSHEPFLFHDGILAITKPFSRTFFSFFTMEFWLSRSLSHELFLFHDGILAITKPFSRTFSFSRWNSGSTQLGEDSFYMYITKSIYIGSASLKTLPLDLEPPLQGKEYGPPYSNATRKRKASVFPKITYGHVIRIF
jgi:hypothetical protein